MNDLPIKFLIYKNFHKINYCNLFLFKKNVYLHIKYILLKEKFKISLIIFRKIYRELLVFFIY